MVEQVEARRQLVQERGEQVGFVRPFDLQQHVAEAHHLFRQRQFLGRFQSHGETRVGLPAAQAALAEDRPDAGVGVLQIGGGVAVQGEQLVPTEAVVRGTVLHQVGVFDRADAHHSRDTRLLGRGQVRVLRPHDFQRAPFGLVEQPGQLDGLALARLDGRAVVAQDGAEPDVFQRRVVSPAPRRREKLAEVEPLAAVGHIDDAVGPKGLDAVFDRRQVGRGVQKRAILLPDQKRRVGQVGVVEEDAHRAVADTGDSPLAQVAYHAGQHGVVETLAQPVVEIDAEAGVQPLERPTRHLHELGPQRGIVRVALLEFRQFPAGALGHAGVGLRARLRCPVDALHLGQRVARVRGRVARLAGADDQQAELRSPIAQVVVGHDRMAEKTQHARQRVAQNGGPDVADVHGFGDVGRAEVDDDGLRGRGRLDAQPFVQGRGQQGSAEPVRVEPEVDEARAGDLPRGRNGGRIESCGHVLRHASRVLPRGFGQRHDAVGLIVAELLVRGRLDDRGVRRAADGLHGLRSPGFQELADCWHVRSLLVGVRPVGEGRRRGRLLQGR